MTVQCLVSCILSAIAVLFFVCYLFIQSNQSGILCVWYFWSHSSEFLSVSDIAFLLQLYQATIAQFHFACENPVRLFFVFFSIFDLKWNKQQMFSCFCLCVFVIYSTTFTHFTRNVCVCYKLICIQFLLLLLFVMLKTLCHRGKPTISHMDKWAIKMLLELTWLVCPRFQRFKGGVYVCAVTAVIQKQYNVRCLLFLVCWQIDTDSFCMCVYAFVLNIEIVYDKAIYVLCNCVFSDWFFASFSCFFRKLFDWNWRFEKRFCFVGWYGNKEKTYSNFLIRKKKQEDDEEEEDLLMHLANYYQFLWSLPVCLCRFVLCSIR